MSDNGFVIIVVAGILAAAGFFGTLLYTDHVQAMKCMEMGGDRIGSRCMLRAAPAR